MKTFYHRKNTQVSAVRTAPAILPILLAVLFAVLFSLTGCGNEKSAKAPSPTGTIYVGSTVHILDEDSPMDEVYNKGANTIELNADGTGLFTLNGDPIDITYEISGTDITMTADGMESVGTLEDGVLTFDYFGMGIEMVFVLQ